METGRLIVGIIMCIIYFATWIYMEYEVLKEANENQKWLVLCSLGSGVGAFLFGVVLCLIVNEI